MTRRRSMSVLSVVFFVAVASAAVGQDTFSWPQFHGANRDNISLEKGLPKVWPEQGPTLLWTVAGLGHGFSSMSIDAGRIYTAGNIGKHTTITALDLDGKTVWTAKNGPVWDKRGVYPGTRSTPTIDGDYIYHSSPLGHLVCLKAKSGEVVWKKDVLSRMRSKNARWGMAESPLIDGDRVISCPGGPTTCMVALNKKTGEIMWKAKSVKELAGYASPIIVEFKGRRIVVTMTAKSIIGVNLEDGELLWRVKHESYADENVLMPIHHEGRIVVSTLAAGSVQWKLVEKGGKIGLEEVWRTKKLDNHHGGVILLDGHLYGNSMFQNKNLWVCLDWKTGAQRYAVRGTGKSSMTFADGLLYTFSIARHVGLVRPSAEKFEIISTFDIPEGGKGKSWAHPVVCNGRLYIRHGEFLYAYKLR